MEKTSVPIPEKEQTACKLMLKPEDQFYTTCHVSRSWVAALPSHAQSWTFPFTVFPTPGCGGSRRGKLYYPLLHSTGCRSLPHPHREPQHLCPGRTVHQQGSSEASEAGHLWAPLLLLPGVQHPGLLSGWHTGCPKGTWLHLPPLSSFLLLKA